MVLKDGKLAGTICCADDKETNAARGMKDCMIGFFDCIEDREVAWAMFEHAKQWAKTHQLETLYGPMNLDYEDSYGVLIEGRDRPPVVLCGHTPEYYQGFFEEYGFPTSTGRQSGLRDHTGNGSRGSQTYRPALRTPTHAMNGLKSARPIWMIGTVKCRKSTPS